MHCARMWCRERTDATMAIAENWGPRRGHLHECRSLGLHCPALPADVETHSYCLIRTPSPQIGTMLAKRTGRAKHLFVLFHMFLRTTPRELAMCTLLSSTASIASANVVSGKPTMHPANMREATEDGRALTGAMVVPPHGRSFNGQVLGVLLDYPARLCTMHSLPCLNFSAHRHLYLLWIAGICKIPKHLGPSASSKMVYRYWRL